MKPRLQNLKNKKILAEILEVPLSEISTILANKNHYYRIKEIPKPDGNVRHLQIPRKSLLPIHARIRRDLMKLVFPDYLHSGVRKRCSITNATQHLDALGCITIDIQSFFPSCKKIAVKNFFQNSMNQSPDIASLMAELVTYEDHVPTGSTLSQMIAYLASRNVFDELARYANNRNLKLTVYVDDITISAKTGEVDPQVKVDVRRILKKLDFKIKNKKTRHYSANDFKRITGVMVHNNSKISPRNLRKKLFKDCLQPVEKDLTKLTSQGVLKSLGLIRAIRRIEGPETHPQLYHSLKKFEKNAQLQIKAQKEQQRRSRFKQRHANEE